MQYLTDVTLAAAGMVTGGAATTSSTEDEHLWCVVHSSTSFISQICLLSHPPPTHARTHPHILSRWYMSVHTLPSSSPCRPISLQNLPQSSFRVYRHRPMLSSLLIQPRLVPFVNDLACATPTATHPPSQHIVSGRQWVASFTTFLLQHPWNMPARHAPSPPRAVAHSHQPRPPCCQVPSTRFRTVQRGCN
jgi:hypothetical protein